MKVAHDHVHGGLGY